MPKSSEVAHTYDADSPRFTREMMRKAVSFGALSPTLQKALTPGVIDETRPAEELVSVRLSKDVVDALRDTGSGRQERVDQHLREWLQSASEGLKKAS